MKLQLEVKKTDEMERRLDALERDQAQQAALMSAGQVVTTAAGQKTEHRRSPMGRSNRLWFGSNRFLPLKLKTLMKRLKRSRWELTRKLVLAVGGIPVGTGENCAKPSPDLAQQTRIRSWRRIR
jgi:hypothetical protein